MICTAVANNLFFYKLLFYTLTSLSLALFGRVIFRNASQA